MYTFKVDKFLSFAFESAYECETVKMNRLLNAKGSVDRIDLIYIKDDEDIYVWRYFEEKKGGVYNIMYIASKRDGYDDAKYIVCSGTIKTPNILSLPKYEKVGKRRVWHLMKEKWGCADENKEACARKVQVV